MKTAHKFYSSGLRFECTQCGNCCQQPGGLVKISEQETLQIALHLQVGITDFRQSYCIPDSGSLKLREQEDGACIFLQDRQCIIYPSRPLQCRTFPFWPENLKSCYRWKQLKGICPGIRKGKFHSLQEIALLLKQQTLEDKGQ